MILNLHSQMLSRFAVRFLPVYHTPVDDAFIISIWLVFLDSERPQAIL